MKSVKPCRHPPPMMVSTGISSLRSHWPCCRAVLRDRQIEHVTDDDQHDDGEMGGRLGIHAGNGSCPSGRSRLSYSAAPRRPPIRPLICPLRNKRIAAPAP